MRQKLFRKPHRKMFRSPESVISVGIGVMLPLFLILDSSLLLISDSFTNIILWTQLFIFLKRLFTHTEVST